MEVKRETVTEGNVNLKARKYVYYILGILESFLAIRLVFKVLGANPASGFVSFVYSLTDLALWPFAGIFASAETGNAVFEPAVIIAMIIYALAAWGIFRLIEINKKPQTTETHKSTATQSTEK